MPELFQKLFFVAACLIIFLTPVSAQEQAPAALKNDVTAVRFVSLLFTEGPALKENLDFIAKNWEPGYESMILDLMRLTRREEAIRPLFTLLRKQTGEVFGDSLKSWYHWLWNQPEQKYSQYAQFKSLLYQLIDKKFAAYFQNERITTIRLDEVVWGGVKQDGIPPLRQPAMVSANEADYLADNNVVFGVEINGDARAYPKRILAWHEMFVDEIGGVEFAGVYCTLCGAVILYETNLDGTHYELGTSGFLYRSNKLMYDKATQSLWNTTWGRPVIGPLAGKGIELKRSYVVTTTWGEWKRRHPQTTVLSLDTGYNRDYGEGIAYQNYFGTDDLMFDVPVVDTRLKNKDEVLALVFPEFSEQTVAIHAEFLERNVVYRDAMGDLNLVVLTDQSGANRVYNSADIVIKSYDGDGLAIDSDGIQWRLTEDALTSPTGQELGRLAAHRAFWFGWFAANNDTRLVY